MLRTNSRPTLARSLLGARPMRHERAVRSQGLADSPSAVAWGLRSAGLCFKDNQGMLQPIAPDALLDPAEGEVRPVVGALRGTDTA